MSDNTYVCKHGDFEGACEVCSRDAEIARLRDELEGKDIIIKSLREEVTMWLEQVTARSAFILAYEAISDRRILFDDILEPK